MDAMDACLVMQWMSVWLMIAMHGQSCYLDCVQMGVRCGRAQSLATICEGYLPTC